MTAAEWLACNDPKLMLEFLHCKISERKLRLFASPVVGGFGTCCSMKEVGKLS
jgi:hypothetical protein